MLEFAPSLKPVTARDQARADALIERLEGFGYDYRMRCSYDGFSHVPAGLYYEQSIVADGVAPCEHCERSISLINENIVVRHPDDPALSRAKISDLAWYHTSTYVDWPWSGYPAMIADLFKPSAAAMPASVFAGMLRREQTKALHLGTYESAIENMYRRMHTQDDAQRQFYLHRVSLKLSTSDIDDQLRHESHDEAAQLALEDLGGFLAVRYLNVEESPGSISIAIDPTAIDTIQTMPLPPTSIAEDPPAHALEAAARLESELAEIEAEMPKMHDNVRTSLILLQAQGDVRALRIRELQRRQWDARQRFEQLLTTTYLGGVNPVVTEKFTDAICRPEPSGSTQSFHDHFRQHAAMLTRAPDVVAELTQQPARTVS
jgi:hypothetical protein